MNISLIANVATIISCVVSIISLFVSIKALTIITKIEVNTYTFENNGNSINSKAIKSSTISQSK